MHKRKVIYIILATIVLISTAIIVVARRLAPVPPPHASVQTLSGKIACLPKKGNGPHTLECATGIQTADGKYYAITETDTAIRTQLQTYPTGKHITVTGTVSVPPANESYDVVGIIAATQVQ